MISRAISATGVQWVVDDFTLRVGSDPPIALPFRALNMRVGREVMVCVPGEDADESSWGGKTYRVGRDGKPEVIATWRAAGNNPVAISDDDHTIALVKLVDGSLTDYYVWTPAGVAGPHKTPRNALGKPEHVGLASANPVRFHTAAARTDLSGRALKLWTEHGPWVFGESKDKWYAFNRQTQQWFLVSDVKTPVANLARLVNGKLIVAVQTEHGGFIHESQFRPISATPPAAAWPVPDKTPLIWRVISGYDEDDQQNHEVPGNASWARPDTGDPVFEGMPDADKVSGPMLAVLIGTESGHKPYPTKPAQLVATINKADEKDCAVAVYSDAPTWLPLAETFADIVAQNDGVSVRVAQAYLQKGESPEDGATRVEKVIAGDPKTGARGINVLGPCGLMQRADGVGTEDEEDEFAARCEQLVRKHRLKLKAVFGWFRPNAHQKVKARLAREIWNMPAGTPALFVQPDQSVEPEQDTFIERAREIA